MRDNIKDREFDKFRPATGKLSRVAVDIENSIPISTPPSSIIVGEGQLGDGQDLDLIEATIPEGDTWDLVDFKISCFSEGVARLASGDELIASCRTAPGRPDASFNFLGSKKLTGPKTIRGSFQARNGAPIRAAEMFLIYRGV